MKLDARDYITILLIVIFLCVLVWVGIRAKSCVDAMNVYYNMSEYACEFCDILRDGGIIQKG